MASAEPHLASTHWRNYRWNEGRFDSRAFAQASMTNPGVLHTTFCQWSESQPAPEVSVHPNSALKTVVKAIDLQRFLLKRFKEESHFCAEWEDSSSSVILQNGVWEGFNVLRFYQRIDQMLEDLLDLEIAVSGHLDGMLSAVQEGLLSAALDDTVDKCWYLHHYAKRFGAVFWGTYVDDSCDLRMFQYEGVSLNDKFTTDSRAVNSWKVSRECEALPEAVTATDFVPFECADCIEMFQNLADRVPFDVHGDMVESGIHSEAYSDSDS
jgi:hypothetical protein